MLKTIFYFVKGCGSLGLNVFFGNTFHKSCSIFVKFYIVFITYFQNFWFRDQAFFFFFFQKYVSCEKRSQDFSEKSYSMLNSFKTCTAVPFDRSLVCKAIVLICKEMFRTLFVSLLTEMLVLLYKYIFTFSFSFFLGLYMFKYGFCAGRTMLCSLVYKI